MRYYWCPACDRRVLRDDRGLSFVSFCSTRGKDVTMIRMKADS